ncbi:hypothetical protein D3C77_173490 [compost metagenome]
MIPIFALEQKAITEPVAEGFIALVEVTGGQGLQLVQNGRNLTFGNAIGLILAGKVQAQVISDQHLTVILAWHIAADIVRVTRLASGVKVLPQQGDNGLLQFCFREDMAHGGGFLF